MNKNYTLWTITLTLLAYTHLSAVENMPEKQQEQSKQEKSAQKKRLPKKRAPQERKVIKPKKRKKPTTASTRSMPKATPTTAEKTPSSMPTTQATTTPAAPANIMPLTAPTATGQPSTTKQIQPLRPLQTRRTQDQVRAARNQTPDKRRGLRPHQRLVIQSREKKSKYRRGKDTLNRRRARKKSAKTTQTKPAENKTTTGIPGQSSMPDDQSVATQPSTPPTKKESRKPKPKAKKPKKIQKKKLSS